MVKVTFIGHACFLLDNGAQRILIDPFITGNPVAKISEAQKKADFILVSHGHGDHLGDAINMAKKSDAMIISNYEIVTYCDEQGVQKTHPLHIGGAHVFPFGSLKLTIAHHGSTLGNSGLYGGEPAGFIIRTGGKIIYHAGDTGLFLDMKLIGEMDKIDLALLPIGGNFTMDVSDAVKAVEFLSPQKAIPMHYGTFDLVASNPLEFVDRIKPLGVEGIVLKPGESYELR
jgi:L-ascorbate metabolism protein UlaG (beta-lactamase superfamily)